MPSNTMLSSEKISYWEQKSFFNNIDYLIIGAGIVGYSTALHLRKANPNSKIVILERGFLPSGASSKNAGFACFGSATELYADLQEIPEKDVWETVKLRWEGLSHLRTLIGDQQLKFETNGSWDLITEHETSLFEKVKDQIPYFNTKLKEITGEEGVYSIDPNVSTKFGFNNVITSIFNRLEGQIDTASMNHAFYKKVIAEDIHVLFGIEALSIDQNNVKTTQGTIQSTNISICTNGFGKALIPSEDIVPARAQVLITEPIKNLKIKGTFHYNKGYYYFRNIDDRILFGGGRNLDIRGETSTLLENTALITKSLNAILKNVILPSTPFKIDHQWAGIMGIGKSKKPIVKKLDDHLFCGLRLGGMGVAIGTLVGKELASLIQENK
ncbi:MAG: FAD-dependent oxidoreductase [Crocinitomicaceae bacterium]|nr:FAD-dependent oxidoreductase [Crocinitomicaceae bacterium]MDG1777068.1 FAD-dependent oxidoreductase [Crocinitomicaceae bacterium]